MKSHPITTIQFLIGMVWLLGMFIGNNPGAENYQTIAQISNLAFLLLGLVTTYLGWLMVFKSEVVIYPPESWWYSYAQRWRSQQSSQKMKAAYHSRSRSRGLGWLNIITGALCTLVAVLILL